MTSRWIVRVMLVGCMANLGCGSPISSPPDPPDPPNRNRSVSKKPTETDKKPKRSIYEVKRIDEMTPSEAAAQALGRMGENAAPEVVALLDSERAEIRVAAANILARIGPPAATVATQPLIKRLSDVNPMVRRAAARALGELGPEASDAIPYLLRAMQLDQPAPTGATPTVPSPVGR